MMRPALLSDTRNPARLVRSAPAPADDRHERDGEAARRLWSATLLQALADARHAQERAVIAAWLGTADFGRLCDLANVDPATVRTAIEAELLLPVRERHEHKAGHARSGIRCRKAPSA